MSVRVTQKTLRVMGPDVTLLNDPEDREIQEEEIEHTVKNIVWERVVDEINDQLPEGYYAKIDDA
jgi:hypothetical protein